LTIECVPNFSEGRDRAVVAEIEQSVRSARGAFLLDSTSDLDHNRSVLTFAGDADSVAHAAFAAVRTAIAQIDVSRHDGVHPRLGAVDVIPFVPLEGATLMDCAAIAHGVGARIWNELRVPVYFYEAAAKRSQCRRLEQVRRMTPAGLAPDLGGEPHSTAGYCVVGARKFLVAWNINLESNDVGAAKEIAREIRESNGGLPAVKALGLSLPRRGQVQVSINLVDFERTPMYVVFDAVASRCKRRGIAIAGSELIGMIPQSAMDALEGHDLLWQNLRPELILEKRLRLERAAPGLNKTEPLA
jgi:glutamate formiminotransferase/glutamate formiminotransferase/formiminotetrahydrofolate cyclodeaminase